MTHNYQDTFIYQSSLQNNKTISKLEQFMHKVQVAKDISKIKNIKNIIQPHCSNILSVARQKLHQLSPNT